MFWGLIMEPQRRYTQQVKKSFHISMAALDVSTSSEEPAQVMCGFEGRNYLLCTLQKPDLLQCPLDLNFEVGSEVSFAANGKCHVHLTGYLTDELLDIPEEEEEEEEQEEELLDDEVNIKNKKRNIRALENGPPSKRLKGALVTSSQDQNDDSDSDDSDFDRDVKSLLGKSLDDSDDDSDAVIDEDEEDGEEEEDEAEDEEGVEEEEEDSSLSEGESDEAENGKVSKPKMNGVSKKQQQESQKQKKDKKKKEKQLEQNKKSPKSDQKKEGKTPNKENQAARRKSLQGGIIIEDIREGQGPPAKNGKFVNVYYEGRLKQNNKLFDSTSKGAGFSFRLGAGEVIKGWDVGVVGMKPGGKRRIICPPSMAYGQKGSPPAIPPNSTLVFEVELKKFN